MDSGEDIELDTSGLIALLEMWTTIFVMRNRQTPRRTKMRDRARFPFPACGIPVEYLEGRNFKVGNLAYFEIKGKILTNIV